MVHWIYTCMVRPYVIYGATAWWPRIMTKLAVKQLSQLKRIALLSMTGAMDSTPTAAMEVLGIPPLHLYVEAEVKKTLTRLNLVFGRNVFCGSGKRNEKTRELMDPILREVGRMDTIVPILSFERNYECIIPYRTGWGDGANGSH